MLLGVRKAESNIEKRELNFIGFTKHNSVFLSSNSFKSTRPKLWQDKIWMLGMYSRIFSGISCLIKSIKK